MALQHIVDDKLCSFMTDVQHGSHIVHLNTVSFPNDGLSIHICLLSKDYVGFAWLSGIHDTRHSCL